MNLYNHRFQIALVIYCIILDTLAYYVTLFYSTPFRLPLSTNLNVLPFLLQILVTFLSISINKGRPNCPPSLSYYIFLTLTVFPSLAFAIYIDTSPLFPLSALSASLGACTGLFFSRRVNVFRSASIKGLTSSNIKLFATSVISIVLLILISSKNISLTSIAYTYNDMYSVRSSFEGGNESLRQIYFYLLSPLAISFLLYRLTYYPYLLLAVKRTFSFYIQLTALLVILIISIMISMTIGSKFGLIYLALLFLFYYILKPLLNQQKLGIGMQTVCMNYLLILNAFSLVGALIAVIFQYDASTNIFFHSFYSRFLFAEHAVSHHVFTLMGNSCIIQSCSFLQAYDWSVATYIGQTIWDANTTATLNSISGAWVSSDLLGVYLAFTLVQYLFSSLEILVLRNSNFYLLPVLMCYSYLLANLEIPTLLRSKGFILFILISIIVPSKLARATGSTLRE